MSSAVTAFNALSGSSPPTGLPPTFRPLATAAVPARPDVDPAVIADIRRDLEDLVAPAPDAAQIPSVITDLFAVFAQTKERHDRICTRENLLWDQTILPEAPGALVDETDGPRVTAVAMERHDGALWYPLTAVECLRTMVFDGPDVEADEQDRRRGDEIIQAYDAWQVAKAQARSESGLEAVEAESVACGSIMIELRAEIFDTPTRSFDEVLMKAAVFAWWYTEEGEDAVAAMMADRAEMVNKGEGGNSITLALAILTDLVTISEARGITLTRQADPVGVELEAAPVTLSGSSAPAGAPPRVAPRAPVTSTAAGTDGDVALIDFAQRTMALARRQRAVHDQKLDLQAVLERWAFTNRPASPEAPPLKTEVMDLSTPTHRITQIVRPLTAVDDEKAAEAAYAVACAAFEAAEAARPEQHNLALLEAVDDSLWEDLLRDLERLTDMRPQTLSGLAAKAEVLLGLSEMGSDDDGIYTVALARAIADDVVRLCRTGPAPLEAPEDAFAAERAAA